MYIQVCLIPYNSGLYLKMIELRSEILRKPLGLYFTDKELESDKDCFLFGVFYSDGSIVGCCILEDIAQGITFKLRQMAISEDVKGKGIGSMLLRYVEEFAKEKGFQYIYLHARTSALGFYIGNGYEIEEDEFIEVGIPHFGLIKTL